MTHTLTIPNWRPTTLNVLIRHAKRNMGVAATKLKKSDANMIAVYAFKQGVPKAAGKRRVDVLVVPGPGQRKADEDAYWKSLKDGLADAGLLVNDNPTWCKDGDVTHGDRKTDGPPRTVITLTDLEA